MNDANKDIIERLKAFPTGTLCNADPKARAMDAAIRQLYPEAKVAGYAATAKVGYGQNGGIHRAAHKIRPGEVLVVDAEGSRDFGHFGDLLATCCQTRGAIGVVIDGSVRDTVELKKMKFPVFATGTNPTRASRSETGEIDIEVKVGGTSVRPGDIIVGDEDGVIVIPVDIAERLYQAAVEVDSKEEEMRAQILKGSTTFELFGMS
ncbi:MAG: RraA family protein [Hyphomicrobiales bacterium]|nr:RraA family protein [Hyphomicrobiales bacterium]MCY4048739.1 RraA family protein [Hyphomicrobiales bacterium]